MSLRTRFSRASVVALIVAAPACDGPVESNPDVEAAALATATYKSSIKNDTLTLTGSSADSKLALRLANATTLAVDIGDDGTNDLTFDRTKFSAVVVDAQGGKDVLRIDESAGTFAHEERVTFLGGAGDDVLTGGAGSETLDGGGGKDTIDGGYGADRILLGAGDDLVTWTPGGGSDTIEAGDGNDRLKVTGSMANETFTLSPGTSGRMRMTRDIAAVVFDTSGLETVDLSPLGGVDNVIVDDLDTTSVLRVDVDLIGSGDIADGYADVVTLRPVAGETCDVGILGDMVVADIGAEVRVRRGEPALDRISVVGPLRVNGSDSAEKYEIVGSPTAIVTSPLMSVGVTASGAITLDGRGGDDELRAIGVSVPLTLLGGNGADTIYGGAGSDLIDAGAGDDKVDGGLAADVITLGLGNDVATWSPGGQNDVIDANDGQDRLEMRGANIGEVIEVGGVGERLRLTRDIASVAIDVGGFETVAVTTLGGADVVRAHDLDKTSLRELVVDLTAVESLSDAVVVSAPGSEVRIVGETDAVTLLDAFVDPIVVRVRGGEPGLDRLVASGAADVAVLGTNGPDIMELVTAAGVPNVLLPGWNVMASSDVPAALAVYGLDGDDTLRPIGGITTSLWLDGGPGKDRITGGAGPDTIVGGLGADVVTGGMGPDRITLGDGDDTYMWNPGDQNDVVDGELGRDRFEMNGSNIGERIGFVHVGSRVSVTRDIASVALDLGGFEDLKLRALGGTDVLTVDDLSGTGVLGVELDLLGSNGAPDNNSDFVRLRGSDLPEQIRAWAEGSDIVTTGLPATVRVRGPETIDGLTVEGGGGVDALSYDAAVEWLIYLVMFD